MATFKGSSGVPVKGSEAEYATELWLDNPAAFFLHPLGPLSDVTPEQWKERRVKAEQMQGGNLARDLGSNLYLDRLHQGFTTGRPFNKVNIFGLGL